MRHNGFLVAVSAAALFLGGCASTARQRDLPPPLKLEGLVATDLRCEYRVNPLGIEELKPRLSWAVRSEQRGQKQTAYQIQVAGSEEKLLAGTPDLWDSGKVRSDATSQIAYGGAPLRSRMQCWWRVRVWDKYDAPSPWQPDEPVFWTMGLLDAADWQAEWIGLDAARAAQAAPLDDSIKAAKWI